MGVLERITMPVTAQTSGPGLAKIKADLARLKKSDILVGVPASTTQRKDEQITNASLMWIHSKGSQINNIPARPTLEPAITENQALISPQLAKASQAIMDNKPAEAEKYMMRAGTIAANAAKRKFGSAELAPNAPSTIARKGSDKPLIDTGSLRRSIVAVVRIVGKQPIQSEENQ